MSDDVNKTAERSAMSRIFDSAADELENQYRAASEAAAVIDRSHLGRVAARGGDRISFLHNMLSADIKNLDEGAGCEGTFLTNKGKLVASCTVFRDHDRVLMETESARVSPLIDALSRYIISEDVVLESLLVEEVSFSVEGPRASGLLADLCSVSASELDALAHLGFVSHVDARITARRRDPSPRFDVAAPHARARELVEGALERGAVIGSAALARTRRIEAGRPRFGVDMDESHMPLEAGLDGAISFDKGCYIGQEYVVRLAHRGHLNRKLVGITIDGSEPPPAGAPVSAGDEEKGEITSAAYSPTLSAVVALGYVRRELFEPGTEVTVDGRRGAVTALPFL
jgi:folate-binding protein YgfZ